MSFAGEETSGVAFIVASQRLPAGAADPPTTQTKGWAGMVMMGTSVGYQAHMQPCDAMAFFTQNPAVRSPSAGVSCLCLFVLFDAVRVGLD